MKENVLIISDLHMPFTKEEFLEHCITTKKRYKTTRTIFIGDILDNHYTTYYESNPDGHSAGAELSESIKQVKLWRKHFKEASVCLGNHDRLVMRKAFTSGISNRWIKGMAEVLDTPNWKFETSFNYNNVLYVHGEGCSNMLQSIYAHRQSIVCGHWHTKFEIVYSASSKDLLWGMNVGCGIDATKYAFEYAKHNSKKQIIGCGVVLDNGRLPILVPMEL